MRIFLNICSKGKERIENFHLRVLFSVLQVAVERAEHMGQNHGYERLKLAIEGFSYRSDQRN